MFVTLEITRGAFIQQFGLFEAEAAKKVLEILGYTRSSEPTGAIWVKKVDNEKHSARIVSTQLPRPIMELAGLTETEKENLKRFTESLSAKGAKSHICMYSAGDQPLSPQKESPCELPAEEVIALFKQQGWEEGAQGRLRKGNTEIDVFGVLPMSGEAILKIFDFTTKKV
jgi:hypothetical protein